MSSFPCLVRFVSGSEQVRYRLGDRLVDRYLEFAAGRCRPNTLPAVAFDQMHPVPAAGQRGGVGARAAADIQQPGRRAGQQPVQQFH